MTLFERAKAAAAIAATVLCAANAEAQSTPACDSLPAPIIYGIGGSAHTQYIGSLASKLAAAADPITVVYQSPGACYAMAALKAGGDLITGTANYWTAAGAIKTCNVPAGGVAAQFGAMQNSPALCANVGNELPAGLGQFLGPVGTTNYLVPVQSSQTSISAEAAYFVYGFGDQGQAEPWIDENFIIKRADTSAVGLYVATSLGIPGSALQGIDAMTNGTTISLLAKAKGANAEAAIGFASGEVADSARDKVRTLAYQHKGQSCGYWPDSSVNAYDKINVRTGQYYLWGPARFYGHVNGSGELTDATVKKFIGYIDRSIAAPADVNVLNSEIDVGTVPWCAMQATRPTAPDVEDLGPISSFQPDEPCGCYFEARATGTTNCDPCDDDDDCSGSTPKCRHGYCEVK